MVIFCVYTCERAKKSPFYVAYTQIGNLCIENLRMRRKKHRKPSYVYMRIRYGAKEITALGCTTSPVTIETPLARRAATHFYHRPGFKNQLMFPDVTV